MVPRVPDRLVPALHAATVDPVACARVLRSRRDGLGQHVPLRHGLTDSSVVTLLPKYDAVTLMANVLATTLVVAANVALLAPDATVTVAGTVTMLSPLPSVITAPPGGAGVVNETVAVLEVPPVTVAGSKVSVASCEGPKGAVTVTDGLLTDLPLYVAVIAAPPAVRALAVKV
jgi:hypothetical protein